MSENPKRKFWQIHLSTALSMMIFTAVLLWINVRLISDASAFHLGFPFEVVSRMDFQDNVLSYAAENPITAIANILVNVGIIVLMTLILESFIRRREACKT